MSYSKQDKDIAQRKEELGKEFSLAKEELLKSITLPGFNGSQLVICSTFFINDEEYEKLKINKTESGYYLTKNNDTDSESITLNELKDTINKIRPQKAGMSMITNTNLITDAIKSAITNIQKSDPENHKPKNTNVTNQRLWGNLKNFLHRITCDIFSGRS
jgi:hypothetical protein